MKISRVANRLLKGKVNCMSSIELDSVDGLNKFEKTLGKLKSKAHIISTINLPQNSGLMIEENKLES